MNVTVYRKKMGKVETGSYGFGGSTFMITFSEKTGNVQLDAFSTSKS